MSRRGFQRGPREPRRLGAPSPRELFSRPSARGCVYRDTHIQREDGCFSSITRFFSHPLLVRSLHRGEEEGFEAATATGFIRPSTLLRDDLIYENISERERAAACVRRERAREERQRGARVVETLRAGTNARERTGKTESERKTLV